jgi:16S rRNA (uracil1498-N3)-methyltransferase
LNRHRFFCSPIIQPFTVLRGREAHHATAVLRQKPGDVVEIFDGAGTIATAAIESVQTRQVTLQIEEIIPHPRPEKPEVILACSLAQGERFDWLISKCTELGVDRICPVRFERTVKLARGEKITERFVNLAIAAVKQCERLFLPRIDLPASLTQTLDTLTQDFADRTILFGSPNPNAQSLLHQVEILQDIIVFIGPEGGLTPDEERLLNKNGGREVRITDTVLRIETAAVACVAILCAMRDTSS